MPLLVEAATYEQYRDQKYFPVLDGIRAVAVMLVITIHMQGDTFAFLAGHLGVTLFFLLSGYLITTLALREEEERGKLSILAFYIRRTFRIFPLYYLTLLVYVALLFGTKSKPEQTAAMREVFGYFVFYLQEIPYFGHWYGENQPFVHAWSLGIEEKFYLVWPFIGFLVCRGLSRLRFRTALLLTLFFALTPILGAAGYPTLAGCLHPYYHILVGCCLAMILHDRRKFQVARTLTHPAYALPLFATFVMVHLTMPTAIAWGFGAAWVTLYTLVAAAVCVNLLLGEGGLQSLLSSRLLTWIGTLSYGIYLVHLLAISFSQRFAARFENANVQVALALSLAVAISVAVAAVLARFIERPMIRMGRALAHAVQAPRTVRPVAVGPVRVEGFDLSNRISEVPEPVAEEEAQRADAQGNPANRF